MKRITLMLLFIVIFPLLAQGCSFRNHGDVASANQEVSLSGKEASWEEQLIYMGYLLYRTSNINVINGLNLDSNQLDRLSKIAGEVEREVPPYKLNGSLSPGLQSVADTYLKLKEKLLIEAPLEEGFLKEVVSARAKESKILREGLTYEKGGKYGDCMKCHETPENRSGRVDINAAKTKNPGIQKEQGYAHISAAIGAKGLQAIGQRAKDVDAVLTDNQKVMLKDFSCCLVPPQGLSNPVRIGQVEASVYEVQLLENVRKIPENQWEQKKQVILRKLEEAQLIKSPDISKKEISAYSKTAGNVLGRARALSDEDFELHKEDLAAEMKQMKKSEMNERQKLFQQAFFLVMPGSLEAYAAAKKRIEAR